MCRQGAHVVNSVPTLHSNRPGEQISPSRRARRQLGPNNRVALESSFCRQDVRVVNSAPTLGSSRRMASPGEQISPSTRPRHLFRQVQRSANSAPIHGSLRRQFCRPSEQIFHSTQSFVVRRGHVAEVSFRFALLRYRSIARALEFTPLTQTAAAGAARLVNPTDAPSPPANVGER